MATTELQTQATLQPLDPMDRGVVVPFAGASVIWVALAAAICWVLAGRGGDSKAAIGWMALFWALSLFDLFALGKALTAAIRLMAGDAEKRIPLLIQASYWGILKLACIGIFGAILLKGHSIPAAGALTGLGTLIFVPLTGGYWWSQKVLNHA